MFGSLATQKAHSAGFGQNGQMGKADLCHFVVSHAPAYNKHYFVIHVYRHRVVIFTFPGPLGLYGSTLIWEQSSTKPGARRREGRRICHYLSGTDLIK